MMRRSIPFWLMLGTLVLGLSGCQPQDEPHKPQARHVPRDEVELSPESPKRGYIKEAVVALSPRPLMEPVPGKLAYDETRTARVFSPIAGRVTGHIADLGAHVRAGDVLAELNSPELGQAQSDHANALADLKLAERAFQRVDELYAHGVAPRKDYEQAQDNLTRARSEAERTRLKLANLGVQGGRTDNRFVLHASIAGQITERNINPGLEVRPDLAAPLFVISDLTQLWLLMDVFEKDIGLIKIGGKVLFSVPSYPGERFTATVAYIGRVVDETTRAIQVRCVVDNAEGRLLPAMYATAEVQAEPDDKAVVAPLSALFTEGESDWLYVSLGGGRYQKRQAKVGLRLKDKAVILEGLKPGERLVVDGALLLRTEQDAEVQTGESAP